MTLKKAIRAAKEFGVFAVYQRRYPSILRGIATEFTEEDRNARDWEPCVPRKPE